MIQTDSAITPAPRDHTVLRWMLRLSLYVYTAVWFSFLVADPDLWGHIWFGQLTWSSGGVVKTDPFSFTAPGHVWINHEWLTEVLFFLIYDAAGSTGLLAFKILLGILIIHWLSSLYFKHSKNLFLYGCFFMIAIPVMAPGFMTRPHLMTYLFLTLEWVALQRGLKENPRYLYWLPVIFLLWTNSHGGVVAGLGILGAVTFIEGARRIYLNLSGWQPLVIASVLSGLAVLINPYGLDLWQFFYESLGKPRSISEWGPIGLLTADNLLFKFLALLFGITLMMPHRKIWWEIAVIAIALVFAFKHQRHTVLAAIVLAPYLPLQFEKWRPHWDPIAWLNRLSEGARRTVLAVVAASMVVQVVFLSGKYEITRFQIWVEPTVYPAHLGQFMERNNINGNLWVPFDWGEYFIWKRPHSRVSVDGRFRTSYPEKVLQQSMAFAHAKPGSDQFLDEYPVRLVITYNREPAHRAMEHLKGWVKIYQDPVSKLFARQSDPLVEAFRQHKLVMPVEPPPFTFPG